MPKSIVDSELPDKLADLVRAVELCDSSGRVPGRFFPQLDPSEYNLEPQISEEELLRRKQSNEKTYTTADVIAYLEKL